MPCERGPVLVSWLLPVLRKRRQMQQHREPRRALHERSNGGAGNADDEVAFPMTGYGTIVYRGRALTNQNLRCHEGLATTARSLARHAQRSPRAQAGSELTSKGTSSLDVQRLVNRFVADAHRSIVGEVDRQAVSDLFGTPRTRPPAMLPWSMAPTLPDYRGTSKGLTRWSGNLPRQSFLDIAPERSIGR